MLIWLQGGSGELPDGSEFKGRILTFLLCSSQQVLSLQTSSASRYGRDPGITRKQQTEGAFTH